MEDCFLVVRVVFNLDACVGAYEWLPVPLSVADPATIPLEEKKRRQNYLTLQPLVVVYLDEPQVRERMKQLNQQDNFLRLSLGDSSQQHVSKRQAPTAAPESIACHLENVTISFASVGLYNVIAPLSINVRQCVGQCTISSVAQESFISDYARLLASAVSPKLPCCVPATYERVWLMQLQPEGTLSYQPYDDLVAASCGCQ